MEEGNEFKRTFVFNIEGFYAGRDYVHGRSGGGTESKEKAGHYGEQLKGQEYRADF